MDELCDAMSQTTLIGPFPFQEFPPEIRLKIWTHALPGPRVVEVFKKGYRKKESETLDSSILPPFSVCASGFVSPSYSVYEEKSSSEDTSEGTTGEQEIVTEAAELTTQAEPEIHAPDLLTSASYPWLNELGSASSEVSPFPNDRERRFQDNESSTSIGEAGTPPRGTSPILDDIETTTEDFELYVAAIEPSNPERYSNSRHFVNIWTSQSVPPIILQVCHEAREVALKHYQLRFATAASEARIYFNDTIDTLFLPSWTDGEDFIFAVQHHNIAGLSGVCHVAHQIRYGFSHFLHGKGPFGNIWPYIDPDYMPDEQSPGFRDLETLTLVFAGRLDLFDDLHDAPLDLKNVRLVPGKDLSPFMLEDVEPGWTAGLGDSLMQLFQEAAERWPGLQVPVVLTRELSRSGWATHC